MNVEEKIKNILSGLSGVEYFYNETILQNELLLDSLSMIMMIIEIEDEFQIRLDEDDMNPYYLETVQDVIDMVGRYIGEQNE